MIIISYFELTKRMPKVNPARLAPTSTMYAAAPIQFPPLNTGIGNDNKKYKNRIIETTIRTIPQIFLFLMFVGFLVTFSIFSAMTILYNPCQQSNLFLRRSLKGLAPSKITSPALEGRG